MEILEGHIFSSSDEEVQMNTTGIIYFNSNYKVFKISKISKPTMILHL